MTRRTLRKPGSRSDYSVGVLKRKPFPPRSGIEPRVKAEKADASAHEVEELMRRIQILTATNTNLRIRLKRLTELLSVADARNAEELPKVVVAKF